MSIEDRLGAKVVKGKRGSLHVTAPQPLTLVEDDDHRTCTIQRDITAMHSGVEDFLVYAYSGKKIVKRLAHGSGGLADLRANLETDNVNYALLGYSDAKLRAGKG